MLSQDLATKLRYFDLKLARMATNVVSGEYASRFRGHGIEFDEVREYVPGDDVRSIDWHVSARMGKPFIKIFREERDVTVYLLIDASPSMFYGSAEKNKWALQADLAGTLAYLGILNDDRVGLLRFGKGAQSFLPARRGRSHLVRLLAGILDPEAAVATPLRSSGLATEPLTEALQTILKVAKRRSVVVLISDFYGENYQQALSLVARKHDLKMMCVSDPLEQSMPKLGFLRLQDSETGQIRQINTNHHLFRQQMASFEQARQESLQKLCGKFAVRYAQFVCGRPVFQALVEFLRFTAKAPSRQLR